MTKKYLLVEKVCSGLNDNDQALLRNYFDELDKHIEIAPLQKIEMIEDFARAVEKYLDEGKTIDNIISLLDVKHLGDFYLYQKGEWIMLDNAAIIYPLGMKHDEMPMFRLSVTLKDNIDPDILQIALYFTIKRFPTFASVVKRGFFWHYLETVNYAIQVEKEKEAPCKPISLIMRSSRSYRVLYYKNRISVELFHVITDGSGGMIFLKTLVGEYLRLLGKDIQYSDGVFDIDAATRQEERYNAFKEAKNESSMTSFLGNSSLQLTGKIVQHKPTNIYHFEMDSDELNKVAKKYGGTITAYVLALMHIASKGNTLGNQKEMSIQVPVNMRKYNHPETLRNYSLYFSASKNLDTITSKEELVKEMSKQIKERASFEEMSKMMSITNRLISSLRYIPLIIKQPVARIAYGYLGNSVFGNCLSNLGVIEVPEEMKKEIENFDFLFVPQAPMRASSTLIGYNGKTRFTIVKATKNHEYENKLFELLKEDGLDIKVYGSISYES